MALTEQDYLRAANDPKFMAARWKQRVAISQAKLDKFLTSNASREEKEIELLMHRKRVEKLKEAQQRLKR